MTIVLYLTDAAPEEAGHTNFPFAGAAPLSVAPKAGSLLAWMNVDEATGEENPTAEHSVGATPADAPHDRVILQFSITLRPQLKRSCPPLPSSWPHSKGFDPLKEVSASRAICSTHVGDDKLFLRALRVLSPMSATRASSVGANACRARSTNRCARSASASGQSAVAAPTASSERSGSVRRRSWLASRPQLRARRSASPSERCAAAPWPVRDRHGRVEYVEKQNEPRRGWARTTVPSCACV